VIHTQRPLLTRRYNVHMDTQTLSAPTRRLRFRRASEPPAFRDDITIVRQLARYRFLRSTHIAALVGRSVDRTNDRLSRLFHAGYLDRPYAQLDYYPTTGSAPMVYALADRGARLLIGRYGISFANVEWSRKNHKAGRPFIDHQLEIVDFQISLDVPVISDLGAPPFLFATREELRGVDPLAHAWKDGNGHEVKLI
jgi:hypothetical protein